MALTDTITALERLAAVARELRAAGVVRLKVAGCELELSPEPGTFPMDFIGGHEGPPPPTADPMDDPATFGGKVPQFRAKRRRSDEGEA